MDERQKKSTQDLDRITETTTIPIENLLADVKRGRVRIPPFQSPFRWEDHDRQKLLDSLLSRLSHRYLALLGNTRSSKPPTLGALLHPRLRTRRCSLGRRWATAHPHST